MNTRSSRLHAPLTCPVCKRKESFDPPNLETGEGEQSGYSHNARVVFASFHCPICLEDKAGPPMVVLSCGHAICPNDFKRLGGYIATASNPSATAANPPRLDVDEESYIDSADDYVDFGSEDEYDDDIARALMYAYANTINGMHDSLPSRFHRAAQSMPLVFDEDDYQDRAYLFGNDVYRVADTGVSSFVLRRNRPKHGLWMLVPRGSNRRTLSLEHYDITRLASDSLEEFALGSRFISTSHGSVFVHAPPQGRQNRSPMWDVFYVKRGHCPVKKYSVPKDAKIISDCHGGIWSLTPVSENPEQMQLMHYNFRAPRGRTVGSPVPVDSQIFMDKGGGVLLLQPDTPHDRRTRTAPLLADELRNASAAWNQTACLWHVTTRRRSLVLQGIPRTSRVVGDASGESVFILSASGRNQSNLTRVWEGGLLWSYDLDISESCIQDIADCGQIRSEVFIHCKCNQMWYLCKVIDPGEIEEIYPCPKNTRILSCRENGVWLWKRTHTSPERSLLNVTDDGDVIFELPGFPSASSLAGLTRRRR